MFDWMFIEFVKREKSHKKGKKNIPNQNKTQ